MLLPLVVTNQYKPVLSGVYDWRQPVASTNKSVSSSVLFEGSAVQMKWLQMTSNLLKSMSEAILQTVPANQEHLYIIKKGTLNVTRGDSSYSLPKGSILVMLPGEKLSFQNKEGEGCEYYTMKYRSQPFPNKERGEKAGGSIIENWNDVEFKPHDRGGVRTFFERPTAMLKRLEMHVTTLNAGLKSHAPHTHVAKEIIVMMEGNTEMQIGEKTFKGKDGSVYFLESNILHGITNLGTTPCTYFAIQFE